MCRVTLGVLRSRGSSCLSISGTLSPAPLTVRNPEGKIRLYCKGADTILLDRLHHSTQELLNTTTDHLNVGVRSRGRCGSALRAVGGWGADLLDSFPRSMQAKG